MAQESPLDVQTLLESIAPAVYKPKPNDPRDPIPQDDRKKFQQQRVNVTPNLMEKYLPELAAEKERLSTAAQTNPLLDFVMKLTAGFTGPADKASGVAGVIAPTANPILKNLIELVRKQAPGLVQKAEGLSQTVFPYLMPREIMPMEGAVGGLRRSTTLPRAEMYIRGGRPQAEQVDTIAHELRHFLTGFDPALMGKSAAHAGETAQQLTHMMPPAQQTAMQSYLRGVGTPTLAGAPMDVVKSLKGGGRQAPVVKDPKLALDEALSYLTEAQLNPQGGDLMMRAVAEALGQGLK